LNASFVLPLEHAAVGLKTNNGRPSPEALLSVILFGFGLGFSFPFGYGLGFCSANFRKERLGCGWSRHLAQQQSPSVIAKLPAVDVLVNNVGIFEPKPFAEIPDADWYRLFEINVMSGVRLSRQYLAGMLERNWGRILFISSESGVQIPAEMVHYGMTKTAQIAVARGIAESVAGTGVTVNSILAGPTESEGVGAFVEAMAKQENKSKAEVEKQFFEHVRPSSLLKRFATVDEVAAMAIYLAGEVSSATNGAALRVDGGVVRAIL
jgi:NAD(P)-dependent dehydrogenase (short-subunit alcohol dehydrogenase family)